MRVAGAFLVLFLAVSAGAVTIAPGDIADAPPPMCWGAGGCIATPPPPFVHLLDNHGGAPKTTLTGPYIVAFGPNGHLFASTGTGITEYDGALAVVRQFATSSTSALTVAQNGDVYSLSFSGVVTTFSPAAAVKTTFPMPFTAGSLTIPPSFDLGADQCAIFYTDGAQTGRRFDACTLQALPLLAPGPWTAVRAMSDGGYAAARQASLSIFDAQNHLVRGYTPAYVDDIRTIAFDIDPHFVWLGTLGTIVKVRLADGANVGNAGYAPLYMAVNGEQRPAAAELSTTIPTLSPALLLTLALGLMILAWQRLRG